MSSYTNLAAYHIGLAFRFCLFASIQNESAEKGTVLQGGGLPEGLWPRNYGPSITGPDVRTKYEIGHCMCCLYPGQLRRMRQCVLKLLPRHSGRQQWCHQLLLFRLVLEVMIFI